MKNWFDIYYPTEASDAARGIDSIRHSLHKWIGLKEANRRKFHVILNSWREVHEYFPGRRSLEINSKSCSLCCNYFYDVDGCSDCPLAKARHNTSCCDKLPHEIFTPWAAWVNNHDPQPMITALRQALLIELRRSRQEQLKNTQSV